MRLEKVFDHGQTQTDAISFGGEERFEDFCQSSLSHTRTRIDDGDGQPLLVG